MHYGNVYGNPYLKDQYYPHQCILSLAHPPNARKIRQSTECNQSVSDIIEQGCMIAANTGAYSIDPDYNATHRNNVVEKAVV